MEKNLLSTYRFLNKNWNAILAGLSVIGVFIFGIIPLEKYRDIFIFMGLNAVVWTVIEIKMKLVNNWKEVVYQNMREARPHILSVLREEISHTNSPLKIQIIGGRIRTISDMMREIINDLDKGKIRGKNITFKILCIHPDFIKTWGLDESFINAQSKLRNQTYSGIVSKLAEELNSYNNSELFRQHNIKLEVDYYKTAPLFYCFLIGEDKLFWGHFTWNIENQDFDGPINPCYFLKKTDENFPRVYNWIASRFDFLDKTGK